MEQNQITTLFHRPQLTQSELVHGRQFTQLQLDVLQLERINIAEEILNHTYCAQEKGTIDYGLRLAELQGQLNLLTYLMDLSSSTNIESNASSVITLNTTQQSEE